LKTSGYKYFFGIFSSGTWKTTTLRLYDQGLLSRPDLVWLFAEGTSEAFGVKLSTSNKSDMELAEALNGTGVVLLKTPERERGILPQLLQDFQ
jgi:hypothetical protein